MKPPPLVQTTQRHGPYRLFGLPGACRHGMAAQRWAVPSAWRWSLTGADPLLLPVIVKLTGITDIAGRGAIVAAPTCSSVFHQTRSWRQAWAAWSAYRWSGTQSTRLLRQR